LIETRDRHNAVLAELRPKQQPATVAPEGAQPSIAEEPVVELSGDELGVEFRGSADMPALRKAAQRWYSDNLSGTSATMENGTVVQFSKRGLRKSTGPYKTDFLLRSVPAIRAIIEHGRIVHREAGNRPDILERVHRLCTGNSPAA
jgi:hypothetical protein